MPVVQVYCQKGSNCTHGYNNDRNEYWQCTTCRLVLCRDCWNETTADKRKQDPGEGFWQTAWRVATDIAAWDCPICEEKSDHHRIFPLEMYEPR